MMVAGLSITLSEWETAGPESHEALRGYFLDPSSAMGTIAMNLSLSRRLELMELRKGLQIKAFSHVGRIQLGSLSITVMPKLRGASLLNLLRYAYGLRNLHLVSEASHLVETGGFEELLVMQLNAEAKELLSRGLQRSYVERNERLSSPRGRIDVGRLARDGGLISASLPCRHYPRIEDTLFNQVLRAGLYLAGSLTSNVGLRRESRRLGSLMDESVTRIRLNLSTMDEIDRQSNRLTASYAASMSIIRLLVEAQGIALEGEAISGRLPGFLFDMNAFFQALLSKFLREHLPSYSVVDERGLKQMMRYNPHFNPQRKQSPTPRPDYAITQGGELRALLDAKYRDLWQKPLPREMLYQLVVYAISQPHHPRSSILYPTSHPAAKEARIDIADPVRGTPLGQVCLRPINLNNLEKLLQKNTPASQRARTAEARRLAFGADSAAAEPMQVFGDSRRDV